MSFKYSQMDEAIESPLDSTASSGPHIKPYLKRLYEYLTWPAGEQPSRTTRLNAFHCLGKLLDTTRNVAAGGRICNLEWTRNTGWVHHTWGRWRVVLSTDIDGTLIEVRRHGMKTTGRGYYLTINGVVVGGHDNLTYDKAKVLFTRAVFMLSGAP